ncbi:aminotransferase class III-fold pyridoxal phosphate-dependent enzyme, partial [Bacillus thuringiensis]|uniref:aminotransferase class III-fold pyridoxal phosphate-dependent enzyme n=1 Tax=Bacillus thuringiensis TaxID=1428 RepID=UPI00201C7DFD
PLGCEAVETVLDIIESEQLNKRSEEIGKAIEERALEWKMKYPQIGEVRRLGAMAAIEIVRDEKTQEPDKA